MERFHFDDVAPQLVLGQQQQQQQHFDHDQQQEQLQQQPITTLSLLEELMSSGLILSDFTTIDDIENGLTGKDNEAALVDIDISSTLMFCDSNKMFQKRFVMHDPPMFASSKEFLLEPTEESVASDLSSDDGGGDDEEEDSLQLASLMNQPRPGLQEDDDEQLQQKKQPQQHKLVHQLDSTKRQQYHKDVPRQRSKQKLLVSSQPNRPGLHDVTEADDCRRSRRRLDSVSTTIPTVASTNANNTNSSSSLSTTMLHPMSPTSTAANLTHWEWTHHKGSARALTHATSSPPPTTGMTTFTSLNGMQKLVPKSLSSASASTSSAASSSYDRSKKLSPFGTNRASFRTVQHKSATRTKSTSSSSTSSSLSLGYRYS